jgi:lipoprotein
MKRRLTAAALVLIFPLSMAACGSQSTADACQELATARTSVHQYSAEHSILDMPIDEVPDHLKKLLDMYRDAGKKVSNKEVKAAFNDVLKDLDKHVDFYRTNTHSTSPEYEQNEQDIDDHGKVLKNLCGFTLDW